MMGTKHEAYGGYLYPLRPAADTHLDIISPWEQDTTVAVDTILHREGHPLHLATFQKQQSCKLDNAFLSHLIALHWAIFDTLLDECTLHSFSRTNEKTMKSLATDAEQISKVLKRAKTPTVLSHHKTVS